MCGSCSLMTLEAGVRRATCVVRKLKFALNLLLHRTEQVTRNWALP
jgi:hypothetical protein